MTRRYAASGRLERYAASMTRSCTWCGRFMTDVTGIRGTCAGEVLYECVNRAQCRKEAAIQRAAARLEQPAAAGRDWLGMRAGDFDTEAPAVQLAMFPGDGTGMMV